MARVARAGLALTQVDTTVIAQEPRLARHRVEIQESLAKLLGVDAARVNVKLKSTDGLGALGRAEGIAAQAVVLLRGARTVSELRLYNTLTRTQAAARRRSSRPTVRIYSCGPTVYSRQHLGNLRTYVFADLLNRTLRYLGFGVRHVINITDVGHLQSDADTGDDKMEKAAREQQLLARCDDRRRVDARVPAPTSRSSTSASPDLWCKATDHIPEQIEMIRALEAKGFTYRDERRRLLRHRRRTRTTASSRGIDLAAQEAQRPHRGREREAQRVRLRALEALARRTDRAGRWSGTARGAAASPAGTSSARR